MSYRQVSQHLAAPTFGRALVLVGLVLVGFALSLSAQSEPYIPSQYRETKGALSGQAQSLDYFYSLDPTCTPRGTVTIRVASQPDEGNITISQDEDYPSYPASNTRSQCNTKKTTVSRITYQSKPGYTGTDEATIEVLFPDGSYRKIDYTIDVR